MGKLDYCEHLYCFLPIVEKGLCGYHLTEPTEKESHYSVYRITFPDGRAFIEATDTRIVARIKEHACTPNSPIGQAIIKPGSFWRGDLLATGLSLRQALSVAKKGENPHRPATQKTCRRSPQDKQPQTVVHQNTGAAFGTNRKGHRQLAR